MAKRRVLDDFGPTARLLDFPELGREAFGLFSADEIRTELWALATVFKLPPAPEDLSAPLTSGCLNWFMHHLGRTLGGCDVASWARQATPDDRVMLSARLKQADLAAEEAERQGDLTGLLLPQPLGRRIELLLTAELLPIVKVAMLRMRVEPRD